MPPLPTHTHTKRSKWASGGAPGKSRRFLPGDTTVVRATERKALLTRAASQELTARFMWRLGVAFRLLTTRSRASPLPAAFPGQGPPKSFVHCILFLRGAADRIRYLSEKKTHVRRAAQERGGPSGGAKQMPAVRLGATPSGRVSRLAAGTAWLGRTRAASPASLMVKTARGDEKPASGSRPSA